MNLNHQILILAVMVSVSFIVSAEKVYESVDEKGVVEFSDKPSSDAQEIQVIDVEKPNVADSIPAESIELPKSASKTKTEEAPTDIEELEVIHQGTADDYDDVRERRKENIERIKEHKGEAVQQPSRKGAQRK